MKENDILDFELLYSRYKENKNGEKSKTKGWVSRQQGTPLFAHDVPISKRIGAWLDFERERYWKRNISIGQRCSSYLRFLSFLCLVVGLIIGCMAMSFVSQSGDGGYVKITELLCAGVFLPMALTLGTVICGFWFYSQNELPVPLQDTLGWIVKKSGNGIQQMLEYSSKNEWDTSMYQILAGVKEYKQLFALRWSLIFQYLGLGYSLGVVLRLIAIIAFDEKNFFWSTTLHSIISAERWKAWLDFFSFGLSNVTQELAANPSAAAMSQHREAWACACIVMVLIWALLPRLILWLGIKYWYTARCDSYHFTDVYYNDLLQVLRIAAPVPTASEKKEQTESVAPVDLNKQSLLILSYECRPERMPNLAQKIQSRINADYGLSITKVVQAQSLIDDEYKSWLSDISTWLAEVGDTARCIYVAEPLSKNNTRTAMIRWRKDLQTGQVNYQGDILFVGVSSKLSGIAVGNTDGSDTAEREKNFTSNWSTNADKLQDRRINFNVY